MSTMTPPPVSPEATVMQLAGRLSGGSRGQLGWRLPGGRDPVASALWHLGDHLAHSDRRDRDALFMAQAASLLLNDGGDRSMRAWRVCLESFAGQVDESSGSTPHPSQIMRQCAGSRTLDDDLTLASLTLRAHSRRVARPWNPVGQWWLTRQITRQANQIIRMTPGKRPVSGRRCAAAIVALLLGDPCNESGRRLASWLDRALGASSKRGVPTVIDPVGEVVTALEVFQLLGLDRTHAPIRSGLSRLDGMIRRLLEQPSGQPPSSRTLARSAAVLWALGDSQNRRTSHLGVRSLMMGCRRGACPWGHISSPRAMAAIAAALASTTSWSDAVVSTAMDHLMSLRGDDGLWSPQWRGSPLMETAACLMAVRGEGIDRAGASLSVTRLAMCRAQGQASDAITRAAVAAGRRLMGDVEPDLGDVVSGDLQRLLSGAVTWSDPDLLPVMVSAVGVTPGRPSVARLAPSVAEDVEPSHAAAQTTMLKGRQRRPEVVFV